MSGIRKRVNTAARLNKAMGYKPPLKAWVDDDNEDDQDDYVPYIASSSSSSTPKLPKTPKIPKKPPKPKPEKPTQRKKRERVPINSKKPQIQADIIGKAFNYDQNVQDIKNEAQSIMETVKRVKQKGLQPGNEEQFLDLLRQISVKLDHLLLEIEHCKRAGTLYDYSLAEYMQDQARADLMTFTPSELESSVHV